VGENVGCARDQKGVSVGMLVQHRYDSREYKECTHVHISSMIWGCIVGGKICLEVFLSKKHGRCTWLHGSVERHF